MGADQGERPFLLAPAMKESKLTGTMPFSDAAGKRSCGHH